MYFELKLLFCLLFTPSQESYTSLGIYKTFARALIEISPTLSFIQTDRITNRVVSLARCTRSIQIDNTNELIKDKLQQGLESIREDDKTA